MGESLGLVLAKLFGSIIDVVFEATGAVLLDFILRRMTFVLDAIDSWGPALAFLAYTFFGACVGLLSLWPFPHPFFPSANLRGMSLFIGPVATGLVMDRVGMLSRIRGKKVLKIESLLYGSAFGLGVALVRFFFTR